MLGGRVPVDAIASSTFVLDLGAELQITAKPPRDSLVANNTTSRASISA